MISLGRLAVGGWVRGSNGKSLSMKMMDRDRETLRWVNGHGCVIVKQVAKEREVGYRNGARRVAALCKAGMIARIDLQISKLKPLVCTPLGCKMAGDSLAPLGGIRLGTLKHDLLVVDVARTLTHEYGGTFEPARRVARRLNELGLDHQPDGIWHRPGGRKPVFIELELSLKSPERLKQIIDEYGANLSISSVLYLVRDAAIARIVEKFAASYSHIRVKVMPSQQSLGEPFARGVLG
jgi:hypothetical protein